MEVVKEKGEVEEGLDPDGGGGGEEEGLDPQ